MIRLSDSLGDRVKQAQDSIDKYNDLQAFLAQQAADKLVALKTGLIEFIDWTQRHHMKGPTEIIGATRNSRSPFRPKTTGWIIAWYSEDHEVSTPYRSHAKDVGSIFTTSSSSYSTYTCLILLDDATFMQCYTGREVSQRGGPELRSVEPTKDELSRTFDIKEVEPAEKLFGRYNRERIMDALTKFITESSVPWDTKESPVPTSQPKPSERKPKHRAGD